MNINVLGAFSGGGGGVVLVVIDGNYGWFHGLVHNYTTND